MKPPTEQRHDTTQNVPIPDPSLLTTEALDREIATLRLLLEVRLDATAASAQQRHDLLVTRLDAMDTATTNLKAMLDDRLEHRLEALRFAMAVRIDAIDVATELRQKDTDRIPQRVDEKIAALGAVVDQKLLALVDSHGEKFASIQTQFRERDVRTEQSSKDSKVAVDAALQAAKEAVGEQNKSSALAIAKSEAATTKQIDQLGVQMQTNNKASDDKITDLKERLTRIEGMGSGASSLWAYIIGGVGVLIGAAGLAFAILKALNA